MILTRDKILSSPDLPREEVQTPEWGGSVFVRTMSGSERDAFVHHCIEQKDDIRGLKARLLCLTLCDETGSRLFGDDDQEALDAKSSKVLDDLFQVAQRLSGLGEDEVEEIAGNS